MVNPNEKIAIKDSIFWIGKVTSVIGRKVKVEVDKTKNNAYLLYKGELLKNVAVNSYIKITKGYTKIIGKIEGESTDIDKYHTNLNYTSDKNKIKRFLDVSLVGFIEEKKFNKGIKELPLVFNDCFILNKEEYKKIHDFEVDSGPKLKIGTITNDDSIPMEVGINNLFASHIGIFGNTGSGKSYTLAKIYNKLFSHFIDNSESKDIPNNLKFIFIDFNGEYIEREKGKDIIINKSYKDLYELNSERTSDCINRPNDMNAFDVKSTYPIQKEQIEDVTFWSIVLEATEKTQKPFIKRALDSNLDDDIIIPKLKSMIKESLQKNDKTLGTKFIIDFLKEIEHLVLDDKNKTIIDIIKYIGENICFNYGSFRSTKNIDDKTNISSNLLEEISSIESKIQNLKFDFSTKINCVRLKIIFQYYKEILYGYSNKEHIAPLIKRMETRIEEIQNIFRECENSSSKNIQIISFKNVSISLRKMLPMLICKQLYEKNKKNNDKLKNFLNIIIDEAHNILSSVSHRETEAWKDYRLELFEEIIKEGRKFGVFLTIASQRPSDITETITSQLHNFFLHRLVNNNDIRSIEKVASYLDKVSFESLPILPTGTCVLAGLSTNFPITIDIDELDIENRPNNDTIQITEILKS